MSGGTLILLVDDEASIRSATATLLRSRGYEVVTAATGAEALALFNREQPALAIVDLGLPDMDGARLCAQLRDRGDMPIVVLSVRREERTKVEALDAGADDYVTKPFGPEELLARIRAVLRRTPAAERERHGQITCGDLTIDFDRHRVVRSGLEIRLTPKEFELLTILTAQPGRVLTHRRLARSIWGAAGGGQQEHLRVLVGQLRKKLETDPTRPRYVLTEPWVGYRFAEDST